MRRELGAMLRLLLFEIDPGNQILGVKRLI
jgi:hypothetical protein